MRGWELRIVGETRRDAMAIEEPLERRAKCYWIGLVLLVVPLFVSCANVNPKTYGRWEGTARFFDRGLHKEYGKFSVAFEVHADNTVTGTVGAASIKDGKVRGWLWGHDEVTGRLEGSVFEEGSLPGQHKDCAVFGIPSAKESSKGSELHLKTNYYWDSTMRECGLSLEKIADSNDTRTLPPGK
jgi:hypothetical protein